MDGTKVRANASVKSIKPIVVTVEMDEYLDRLYLKSSPRRKGSHPEDKDFPGEKLSNETIVRPLIPDACLYKKSPGQEASLS